MRRVLITLAIFSVLFGAKAVIAAGDWTIDLVVTADVAQKRLVIGQSGDALDGFDNAHDIEAMPGGSLVSVLELDGGGYWQNIQAACGGACVKEWRFLVESASAGDVVIRWGEIPVAGQVTLTDLTTGGGVDMGSAKSYRYRNDGRREFLVTVRVQ